MSVGAAGLHLYSRAASLGAMLLGLVVIAGWFLDNPLLMRVVPGFVAMNPLTATAFTLAGAALWLRCDRSGAGLRNLAHLFSVLVVGAGVLTLVSYAIGTPGPDQALFAGKLTQPGSVPNRMAPNTAFNFILVGAALLWIDFEARRGWRPSEWLALLAGFVALVTLVGYIYGVQWIRGLESAIPMAVHTAAGFVALALGILAARPSGGLMSILTSDNPGGAIARGLIPAMALSLLLLGWLRLQGEQRGIYGPQLGVTLDTVVIFFLLSALVIWNARLLALSDRERHRTEAERERFFTLSRDMLCIAGLEGGLRRVNPAWSRTLGFSVEELSGRSLLELLHEDDVAGMRVQLAGLAEGRETEAFENRVRAADGSYRWLLWSAVPIPRERIFYATARDITDRRRMEQAVLQSREALESRVHERTAQLMESEERARQIVDAALDAVVTIDATGRITGWNARAESMFGWRRQDAIGRDLAETIIPPGYREAHRRGLQRFNATGHANLLDARIELEALYRDGRVFPVELSITPLQRAGEWNFSAFVRDITRRKQAERALREGEEKIRLANVQLEERVRERTVQLENANKELEAFSYSISHDLRAPLRHVQGYVEMLKAAAGDQLTDKARRYLKVISDASVEMGQLIDDLLAFSRMARAEIREAPVDVAALAREIVKGLEMEARGRTIDWRIGLVPPLLGDPAMVRQVLANLLGNAAKYTRARDPAVIELGYEGEHEGRGVVYVRDNGAGFEMQYVHKLFGVFQRLHRAEEFEGTGIGLATVRRIIARHGGRVWAEGELGKGATFRFTLRLAVAARRDGPEEASQNAA